MMTKPPGKLFRLKTRSTIFVVAILANGVVAASFQSVIFPPAVQTDSTN